MRLVLATPLYPPEIAEPAPYIKELARRLSARHQVTIVVYERLPEPIPGIAIRAIDKRRPLPLRLVSYFFALLKAARSADLIYAENGASVELPAALVAILTRTPLVMHVGDIPAYAYAQKRVVLRLIQRLAFSRAKEVVRDMPLEKPELLPLEPYPAEAVATHEASWQTHMSLLEKLFNHDA